MTTDGWKSVTLGDFVTLQRGHDLPEYQRQPGAIPILGSFGVTGYHNESVAKGPGVTVGRSGGSMGVVSYSNEDFWPLNTALYVIDFHGNNERFAYYLLKELDFTRFNSGSAQQSLNRNFIHPIPIEIPPIPEQRMIAYILGTLDDKIELNRRMNETLEAMAQALFRSWFVDFDPVRAKAEGRQPMGMDAGTAALFPSSFQESSMGELPDRWLVVKAGSLFTISRESISPDRMPDEVFDHYSIPAYDEGQIPKVEAGAAIKSNKFIVPEGAVLLSKLNPHIPRVWLPDASRERRSICSTEFLVTCTTRSASVEYLYDLFNSSAFQEVFCTLVTGTSGSHQRVLPDHALLMDVVRPSEQVIEAYTNLVQPLHTRVNRNLQESLTLAAIRDALLPRLLSGEIRVKDAEQVVSAAM